MSQPLRDPPPYIPPPCEAPQKNIPALHARHLGQWLRAGWGDMYACPGIAAFYGGAFWVMALILGAVFRESPEYAMTVASGCILVGPFCKRVAKSSCWPA